MNTLEAYLFIFAQVPFGIISLLASILPAYGSVTKKYLRFQTGILIFGCLLLAHQIICAVLYIKTYS